MDGAAPACGRDCAPGGTAGEGAGTAGGRARAACRAGAAAPCVAGEADADVLAVATAYGEACVQVLFYRDGHSVSSQAFFPRLPEETPEAEVLAAFITQFYHERNAPPQLVISHALEGGETIAAWLGEKSGRKVSLNAKPREARRKWLELAEENARLSLGLRLSGKLTMQQRFAALAEAFAWPDVPERLECIVTCYT